MIKEDILDNILEKTAEELIQAIKEGVVTLNECKMTGKLYSPTKDVVEAFYKEFQASQNAFAEIERISSDFSLGIQKCEEYLSKYPNSDRSNEVHNLKKGFEEGINFNIALQKTGQNKIYALERFIERNPTSKYKYDAEAQLEQEKDQLEFERRKMVDDIKEGRYTKSDILEMFENGKLSEDDLVPNYISKDGLIHYKYGRDIDFEINEELGDIRPNSTDVFFIGVPDAGKSCLLSGLLLYMQNYYKGLLDIELSNPSGKKYSDNLLYYAGKGLVPGSTLSDEKSINYIATNVQNEIHPDRIHPINFIEMSGEHITKVYDKLSDGNLGIENIPFHQYLKSENDKYFFIIVDYKKTDNDNRQNQYLQTLLTYFKEFKEHGILERTKAINLILTKSDLLDGGTHDMQIAKDFITKEGNPYNNLFTGLKEIYRDNPYMGKGKKPFWGWKRGQENNQVEPKIYPFSLGTFHLFDVSFTYDGTPSKRLFRDIINNSMAFIKKKK